MNGNLRFGLSAPADWLEKAKRELKRLRIAEGSDKIDHAINAAITISQVADWCFNDALTKDLIAASQRSYFLNKARKASPDTAILTDISNTTKHFKLDRSPASTALSVSSGQVVVPREFLFSAFRWPEQEPFKGHIKAVRTIIDDDEIIGFHYSIGEHRVLTEEGYVSFEMTCDAAIDFWESAMASIEKGAMPSWLS